MAIDSESRILIIDDFEMLLIAMRKALENLGFKNIDQAEDGTTAWQMIESAKNNGEPYALIFSDWTMPEMSGMDLFRKIKIDNAIKTTPFVMVTAESEKKNVMSALSEGVTEYIVKPCTIESLEKKITIINKKLEK
ncbi:MAG: response regulator [Halobacteriovoraceae bacterium]|nr:response regulator [Halobacteriovoraceae bacterium]